MPGQDGARDSPQQPQVRGAEPEDGKLHRGGPGWGRDRGLWGPRDGA